MQKVVLRDIQIPEFRILESFVDSCNKKSLTYYISGGTYLGALRHQGFIPWDDDIDVAMPRLDYEQFLDVADTGLPDNLRVICLTFMRMEPCIISKDINLMLQKITIAI